MLWQLFKFEHTQRRMHYLFVMCFSLSCAFFSSFIGYVCLNALNVHKISLFIENWMEKKKKNINCIFTVYLWRYAVRLGGTSIVPVRVDLSVYIYFYIVYVQQFVHLPACRLSVHKLLYVLYNSLCTIHYCL